MGRKKVERGVVTAPVIMPTDKSLKLDFGCGPNKREGFHGVDNINFPNVDFVCDLREKWPWHDNSVEEGFASHFLEHLTGQERVHFVNELYRVLVPGGKTTIVVPHWASCRAYGDPTHKWPPVSEFWFYYLLKDWRMANAPHTDITHAPDGFSCNFEAAWGYALHPQLESRNQDMKSFAQQFYKEAAQDMIATLTKK
jgi:SAM-dependent methyltransferase